MMSLAAASACGDSTIVATSDVLGLMS